MRGKLLICVGCQKGGTDWLANYFDDHHEMRGGLMKEMEVFSVHFIERFRNYFDVKIAEAELLSGDPAPAAEAEPGANVDRQKRQTGSLHRLRELSASLPEYAAYYRGVLDDAPAVDVVYDISPNYAALTAEHWREVRRVVEAEGLECRMMLIMRDPVERVISAWRMTLRKRERLTAARNLDALGRLRKSIRLGYRQMQQRAVGGPDALFLNFVADEMNLLRSRYDVTMRALEAAFPAERIHYEFFETLFAPEAVQRIASFLDIEFLPAPMATRINSSPPVEPIAPETVAKLREALEPTYAFCAERFGAERIAALWPHADAAPRHGLRAGARAAEVVRA